MLKAGGEGDDKGWDGLMASPTQWTWIWVDSRSWWWTGKPGLLWFIGSQRVGHDWATELNWTDVRKLRSKFIIPPQKTTNCFGIICWKDYPFLTVSGAFEVNPLLIYMWVYFWTLYSVPLHLSLYQQPWYDRRKWQPTPVFLPGKSHDRRSLVGYSPWVCKESDVTERFHCLHCFTVLKLKHWMKARSIMPISL